jgi:nucleoside-diphosphate-sugar epimerase
MANNIPKVIVTGATSMIGHFLLPRLVAAGYEVHAISRKQHIETNDAGTDPRVIFHVADITDPEQFPQLDAVALIHLGPLWLLPPLLPRLSSLNIRRVIGFGSTSLISKLLSADAGERKLVSSLAAAESAISQFCAQPGTNWTVFRPTLIYDCARDKNITVIARFIKRYGFFPLAGRAVGLRQPVHADDLAAACVTSLNHSATFNKVYNLSGGETLSYREMVTRIFAALGKRPRFVSIPLWLFQWAIRVASRLPSKRNLTGEMAARMNADLCFDHADAARDFGFAPRPLTLRY